MRAGAGRIALPRRTDAGNRAPPNWIYSGLDADTSDGCWYKEDGKFTGLQQSIEGVEAAIVEQGIVGVVGHEQGATLAAVVAARSALGRRSLWCYESVIIISYGAEAGGAP